MMLDIFSCVYWPFTYLFCKMFIQALFIGVYVFFFLLLILLNQYFEHKSFAHKCIVNIFSKLVVFYFWLYFLEQLEVQRKIGRKIQWLLIFSLPLYMCSPVMINIFHQSGTSDISGEPALTHRNHPESVGYTWVHSYTIYGFQQMNNDMYPPLQYHTE